MTVARAIKSSAKTRKTKQSEKALEELPPVPITPAPKVVIPASEPVIEKEIAVAPPVFDLPVERETLAFALLNDVEKDVARTVTRYFTRPRDPYYSEWNSASEIGDPCIRHIVYQRLYPEQALPLEEDIAFIFKHGNWVEKEIYNELAEAGYEVIEQQRQFVDRDLKIKGKIDGKIVMKFRGETFKPPFDGKGYAPDTWSSINTAKDLLDNDRPYLKKVPAQITLYNVLDTENKSKVGLIYMKNKLTGKPKQIVIPVVQEYVEWLLKRVRMINDYVARKTLPPRIEYDEQVCEKCPFRAVCLKETPPGSLNPVVLDPEKQAKLLEKLKEREKLDPLRKQFKKLDDDIHAIVQGHEKILLGDYVISGKWISSDRLDEKAVPTRIKKKYIKTTTYWKKTITNVKMVSPKEDE